MYKLLLACLLLSTDCAAQKIELSTGNGLNFGVLSSIHLNPHFILKGMYNPTNYLQLGVTGAIGVYNWGDAFCNIYPTGISGTRGKLYVGVNAGYMQYTGEENNHPGESVNGKGMKAGLQFGFITPITHIPRMVFYGESGASVIFASAQHTSNGISHGTRTGPTQQETRFFVPLHFGLRYRLKM